MVEIQRIQRSCYECVNGFVGPSGKIWCSVLQEILPDDKYAIKCQEYDSILELTEEDYRRIHEQQHP